VALAVVGALLRLLLLPLLMLLALMFLKQPVSAMQAAGLQVEGDAAGLQALIDALDPMPQGFAIIEP
jgi:alkyl sulfatase BDS1-like metallo-beta-lactamase superfamily hydrolase